MKHSLGLTVALILASISGSVCSALIFHHRNLISTRMSKVTTFFKLPVFAVVGASNNREKFGNKVLRIYQNYGRVAVPISKVSVEIEGSKCVDSLTTLADKLHNQQIDVSLPIITDLSKVGVSIITPPTVTRNILEEGLSLGYRHFFLQPGTVDETVKQYITEQSRTYADASFIENCVLVQLPLQNQRLIRSQV